MAENPNGASNGAVDVESGNSMPGFSSVMGRSANSKAKVSFCFRDCRFKVKVKGGEKQILKGITSEARSGEVLAIMGPSGAGKTQLMNLLSLVDGPGEVSGDVTLNGHPFSRELFIKYAGAVPQADFHWAFLTCRETVQMAADLLNLPNDEKQKRVESILKRTGLADCADTRVGNQFIPGLSGGQKRRLSIAVLLLRRPLLVFLDEPTSGLDAAAAFQIMNFISELAADLNITVVATIHQPSTTVYQGFDGIMLLSSGRLAYQGPAAGLPTYLEHIGKPLPAATGVAEWALDLVNSEFSDPEQVAQVLDTWPQNEQQFAQGRGSPAQEEPLPDPSKSLRSSFANEFMVLLKRHALLTMRDPTIYLGRAVVNLMACIFFAIVYIESRAYNQEQAPYHMFLIMWFCGVPACMGVIAVFAFNSEFKKIKAEVNNGMYKPISYLAATTVLEIPMMFLLSICVTVAAYGVSNYREEHYLPWLLVYTIMLWSFECIAQSMALSFNNPLVGAMMFMNCWFCSFLFCGIMVPEDDVPWPFKIAVYVFPFRYSLSSLLYIDMHDTNFGGAIADANNSLGYSCPDLPKDVWCMGFTGKQVLDSLGRTYESVTSENNVVRDAVIMLAIGAFFKFQYVVLLMLKSAAHRVPVKAK